MTAGVIVISRRDNPCVMRDSPIPSLQDIRARTDMPVFEVVEDLAWMVGPVQVESNDFQSVISFARAVGSRVLLVQYDYPDFDDYYVEPRSFDIDVLFGEEREDEIRDLVEERNDEFEEFIEKEYDGEPFAVSIYVKYEGTPYGIFIEDDALIESFGETADEFVTRLIMEDEEDAERSPGRLPRRA